MIISIPTERVKICPRCGNIPVKWEGVCNVCQHKGASLLISVGNAMKLLCGLVMERIDRQTRATGQLVTVEEASGRRAPIRTH